MTDESQTESMLSDQPFTPLVRTPGAPSDHEAAVAAQEQHARLRAESPAPDGDQLLHMLGPDYTSSEEQPAAKRSKDSPKTEPSVPPKTKPTRCGGGFRPSHPH